MQLAAIAGFLLLLLQSLSVAAVGSIQGTVLRSGTKEPLSSAQVVLVRSEEDVPWEMLAFLSMSRTRSANAEMPGPVHTGRDGRFAFTNLASGSYRILVTAAGYLPREYGALTGAEVGAGTVVIVTRDEPAKAITLELTPAGSVSGRVINSAGDPILGADVYVLKPGFNEGGQRTFDVVRSAFTDDRGDYRVFGLMPGNYFVCAQALPAAFSQGRPMSPVVYATSYYPSSPSPSTATLIEIRAGTESSGINFSLNHGGFRVRAQIVDSQTGRWPAELEVSLGVGAVGVGKASISSQAFYDPADGTIEILGLMPGIYALRAKSEFVPFRITTSDIEGLMFTLGDGVSLQGRVGVEGQAPSNAIGGIVIVAEPFWDGVSLSGLVGTEKFATPKADGSFELEQLMPDREYRVTVRGLPDGYYVKAIDFEGVSALNRSLRVASGRAAALAIVLSPNASQLEGVVRDANQKPLGGVSVVLIPDRLRDRADLYKKAKTGSDGSYTVSNITPGTYKVFAWEYVDDFAWFDAEFLRKFEAQGIGIGVGEGAKNSLDLKVIPIPEN